jgi:hypothetical protein
MRCQKMVEDVQWGHDVRLVPTRLAGMDVIDNHVADFFSAVLLLRKILGKGGSGDFGQMLVLSDGKHLVLGQTAKGHAVLKRNHPLAHGILSLPAWGVEGVWRRHP